ncbi:MAG: sigma-70 family RNA polymerase sigma factor [Sulfitobacter sp.]
MAEQLNKNEQSSDGTPDARASPRFEELVRAHSGWMLALANRILNNSTTAEDAVQNAFVSIHKGLDGFENLASVKTWMHRIVVNEALMVLRKSKRLQEQSLDGVSPKFDQNGCRVASSAVIWDTPETELTSQQTLSIVRSEINSLPDDFRLVLVLRDIEGIPTAEAADLLRLSEANVRVRLHRARAALKIRLEPLIMRGVL